MPTNVAIDDELLAEAQRVGKQRTTKDTVTAALKEYIARRTQLEVIELFGTLEFDPSYDYERARGRETSRRSRGRSP